MSCNKCGSNGPFPNGSRTLCKACDAARKAAWYQKNASKHGIKKTHQSRGPIDPKPSVDRVCQDCGEIFSYARAKRFCEPCIKRHESEAREALKADKALYDHQYRVDGHRGPKSESEKEYNKEYMRGYRERKKND